MKGKAIIPLVLGLCIGLVAIKFVVDTVNKAEATGKPKETVLIDPLGPDGSITYWRDEDSIHHVPKRSLGELIVN